MESRILGLKIHQETVQDLGKAAQSECNQQKVPIGRTDSSGFELLHKYTMPAVHLCIVANFHCDTKQSGQRIRSLCPPNSTHCRVR